MRDAVRLRNVEDEEGTAMADDGAADHGTSNAGTLPGIPYLEGGDPGRDRGERRDMQDTRSKFRSAGHVARFTDGRWTRQLSSDLSETRSDHLGDFP